jgi:hypothetical protein
MTPWVAAAFAGWSLLSLPVALVVGRWLERSATRSRRPSGQEAGHDDAASEDRPTEQRAR